MGPHKEDSSFCHPTKRVWLNVKYAARGQHAAHGPLFFR